jgi:hypothetical protein
MVVDFAGEGLDSAGGLVPGANLTERLGALEGVVVGFAEERSVSAGGSVPGA